MPSQSDVEIALVELVAGTFYPNGLASAPAISAESRVYRGWPSATTLEKDLSTGVINVSVLPIGGAAADTTRYLPSWLPSPVIPTLTVSVAGDTVTFAGAAGVGQLAGILIDGHSFVHRVVAGDTPELIASLLASVIAETQPASVSDSTITIDNATTMVARTAADASASLELRRQKQSFRLTVWSPTPELRDDACAVLDVALAATPFLTLSDGSAARMQFMSTTSLDEREDAMLYRRDMTYTVEYPTTQVAVQPSMLFGILGLGATTKIA